MDKGAKQLGRRMLAVYRETEPRMAKLAEDVKSTCKQGCAACCNIQVYTSLPEAVAIVEPMMHDQRAVADLVQRCEAHLPVQKLDRTEHFAQGVPCMFLTGDKLCGIYDRRPVSCRNHIVVSDPANCAYSPEGSKEVQRLNTERIDAFMLGESLRVSKQRQLPVLLAPLPIALLWALRLLAEGEAAFVRALESPEDLGILDIRGWTQHALRVVNLEDSAPPAESQAPAEAEGEKEAV